ncbi:hypothetical protein, partial [Sinomonas humi]|uniref:hypothetical protein n=1 Tax=Sinomonas humi TaxID=1338436 RepID=UPI001E297382
ATSLPRAVFVSTSRFLPVPDGAPVVRMLAASFLGGGGAAIGMSRPDDQGNHVRDRLRDL